MAGAVNLIALCTFLPARERYGLSLCCVAVRMVARPLSAAMSYAAVENTKEFLPPPMSALGQKQTLTLRSDDAGLTSESRH